MFLFFFFNDTATTEIYTLSLHDALPISVIARERRTALIEARLHPAALFVTACYAAAAVVRAVIGDGLPLPRRSEEHTSELQSHLNLVCRLLLEKKKHTTWRALLILRPGT